MAIEEALRVCWEDSGNAKAGICCDTRTCSSTRNTRKKGCRGELPHENDVHQKGPELKFLPCRVGVQASAATLPEVNAEMAQGVQLLQDHKIEEAAEAFTRARA